MSELKQGLVSNGRNIALDEFSLLDLASCLKSGMTRKQAISIAGISKSSFHRYLSKSGSFRELVERCEASITIIATKGIRDAIVGKPSLTRNVLDKNGNLVTVQDPAIPCDVKVAIWWLERSDRRFARQNNNEKPINDEIDFDLLNSTEKMLERIKVIKQSSTQSSSL